MILKLLLGGTLSQTLNYLTKQGANIKIAAIIDLARIWWKQKLREQRYPVF